MASNPGYRLSFVYRESQLLWGSTTMRAHQLRELVSPHLVDKVDLQLTAMPDSRLPHRRAIWAMRQPRDTVFFFTKAAARSVSSEILWLLRRRGGRICFDYVDHDLRKMARHSVDIHVAASLTAFRVMNKMVEESKSGGKPISGEVRLLMHNADARLRSLPNPPTDRLRIAYLGAAKNTFIPDSVKTDIRFLNAYTSQDMETSIRDLPRYNAHYCLRPAEEPLEGLICKPFTKGFTAAACKAVPLANRDTDDVLELLGEDYPYLIDRPEEALVKEMIARIKDDFGGKTWAKASERTRQMGVHAAPERLANNLWEVLRDLMG